MFKLFKRSSKPVTDGQNVVGDQSPSVVHPTDGRRELLIRYVGKGTSKEPVNEIFEKSNVGKYCRVTIQDECLIVTELTDIEVVRISSDQIKHCLQNTSNEKLNNCIAIIVSNEATSRRPTSHEDALCYLFETCSLKEVSHHLLICSTHY